MLYININCKKKAENYLALLVMCIAWLCFSGETVLETGTCVRVSVCSSHYLERYG